ncbi:MAG: crossover junction endodeoxyribonuclease RuvC [Deltaproteobacteria bacterium]|jgi:crossover junction endodeoxyribonuclease RuvC|nr:MAG: crossover junction endodeoxyribonuclease RuvC [Deltaproteobacteria bacterium]
MRVLGVDPGSRVCGYGVLESKGDELIHIESGGIVTNPSIELPLRLKKIYETLVDVINRLSPSAMSIEDVFFAKNAKSALKLGEARGVALLAAAVSGIPVYEYAPTEVKLALTGRGRANKLEVQKIVSKVLGIPEWKRADVSDAVAIAICHINLSKASKRLGNEVLKLRRRRIRWTEDDISSKGKDR